MEWSEDALWRQILWAVLFSCIAIVGSIGNIVVIWIVLRHKQMRTLTNIFIVNLAVADTLVALINVIFTSYPLIYKGWVYNGNFCVNIYIRIFAKICLTVSVLTHCVIAFDRHTAIISPFEKRWSKQKRTLALFTIWLLSILLRFPLLKIVLMSSCNRHSTINSLFQPHIMYFVMIRLVTYIIPLAFILIMYIRIGKKLWSSIDIGEITQNHLHNIEAKRTTVKMMITAVVIFGVSQFPYKFILIFAGRNRSFIDEIDLAIFWLSLSNTIYNPIIYCCMSVKFHDGFKKAFRWCSWVKYSELNSLSI